jgi:hypothetical protein
LYDISEIKEDIQEIKSAFLIRDGTIVEKNIGFNPDTIKEVSLLIDFVRYRKENLKKLLITGKHQLVIFLHNSYILGVLASPDVDARLLKWMAERVLRDLSLPEGMSSEEVRLHFRSEYKCLQKEVLKLLYEIKELKEKNKLLEQEIKMLKNGETI